MPIFCLFFNILTTSCVLNTRKLRFVTGVLGQPVGPVCKSQTLLFWDCLTVEGGTIVMSRKWIHTECGDPPLHSLSDGRECTYLLCFFKVLTSALNPLTPNDHYNGRTAPLTSKLCILYIYSTNIGTEYFKHRMYSPFFSLQNAVCFVILMYFVPVLLIFYIQDVLKLKNNSSAKRLIVWRIFR